MRNRSLATPVRGYSLAELIVSVGIFSMVMLIVTSVYLALISYDRQARATNELASNLSFSLESMIRNIRTGTNYTCSGDPCTSLTFTNSDGVAVHYRRNTDGTIGQCTGAGANGCNDATSIPLTDTHIDVDVLSFYVSGVPGHADAAYQPQVTVVTRGTMATDVGKSLEFSVQMTATQRLLDLP